MGERIPLNDAALDMVTGGAFNFYSRDGKPQCYVDGVGTFYCSEAASSWIIAQVSRSTDLSPSAVVAEAMEKGLFWK